MSIIYFPIIVSLFVFVAVWFFASQVKKTIVGLDGAPAVKEGLLVKIKKQYKKTSIAGIVFFILLLFGIPLGSWKVAVGFLIGAFLVGCLGVVGSALVGRTNKKIVGMAVVGLGLLATSFYYLVAGGDIQAVIGMCFGVGLMSIFIQRVFVDVFGTYILTLTGTIIMGEFLFPRSPQFIFLPLILASTSILISIISYFFGKKGFFVEIILLIVSFYFVIEKLMSSQALSVNNLYFCAMAGLLLGGGVVVLSRIWRGVFSVLLLAGVAVLSFWLAGFYGVALAATVAISIFPMVNDAGSEIAGSVKNYSSMLAILASAILFLVYFERLGTKETLISLITNSKVVAGLIVGALLPYLLFLFWKRTGGKISSKFYAAQLFMIILAPILISFILGASALSGLLVGSIIFGLFVGRFVVVRDANLGENKNDIGFLTNLLIKDFCVLSLLIVGFLV